MAEQMAGQLPDEFPPERIARCLEGFYNLALERSRTGTETVLRHCEVCGSEERRTESGRLVIEHHYAAHHPAPAPSVEIDVPQRAGEYGAPNQAMIDRDAARARARARAEQYEH